MGPFPRWFLPQTVLSIAILHQLQRESKTSNYSDGIMHGLSLVGKKATIKTTSDNSQRRPFIEPMISPSKKKRVGLARKVAQNNKNDAVIHQLLFENREKSRHHIFKIHNEMEENLPVNSPNATAWLRSQGLLFQTDIRGIPTVALPQVLKTTKAQHTLP